VDLMKGSENTEEVEGLLVLMGRSLTTPPPAFQPEGVSGPRTPLPAWPPMSLHTVHASSRHQ
jgi:hypothetical protein